MGTISDYKLLDSPYDYMQVYRNGELLTSTDNKTDESEKERFHNANVYYIGKFSDKLQVNVDADYVYSRLNHWQQVIETSRIDAVSESTHIQNDQRNRAVAFKDVFAWNISEVSGLDFGTDFSRISSWGTSVNEEGKIADDRFKTMKPSMRDLSPIACFLKNGRGASGFAMNMSTPSTQTRVR